MIPASPGAGKRAAGQASSARTPAQRNRPSMSCCAGAAQAERQLAKLALPRFHAPGFHPHFRRHAVVYPGSAGWLHDGSERMGKGMTKPQREALLVALAAALCVAVFFRAQIGNGFTLLLGDRHDGVIELAILEHWRNVLRGAEAWNRTGYFWPVPDTLGYNDGYLAFGLLHALFRGLGADPFLSGECVNMSLRALGFAGAHVLARRMFGLRLGWALLAAALFTLANNLAIRASHAQLFGVSLAPCVAALLAEAVRALLAGRRGALLGWGAGFLLGYAVWLMSGFYMAWYFAFLGGATLLAWLALAGGAARLALWRALRAQRAALAALAALGAALLLPFALTYLPKAAETGMHPWAKVRQYAPTPLDILHVGAANHLWGWLVRALNGLFRPEMPFWSEEMTGFPLALLALFAAALWRPVGGALPRALLLATAITWALTLRIGDHSAWWLVYQAVPGAKAARVVARYQLFLALPVSMLAVAWLAAQAPRVSRLALGLLVTLLLAEQLNGYTPTFLDRPHELARLNAVPAPPAECRAFFVTAARTESRFGEEVANVYNHNTEAMLVAEVIGLPTINGISTFNPPLWPDGLPGTPEYLAAVRRYAAAHRLEGLCGLDLQRFAWSLP